MNLNIQFKIKNNPNYQRYIRENSGWYKLLNRNPNLFREFEEEVKDNYELRPSHKIMKTLDNLEMITTLFNNLK